MDTTFWFVFAQLVWVFLWPLKSLRWKGTEEVDISSFKAYNSFCINDVASTAGLWNVSGPMEFIVLEDSLLDDGVIAMDEESVLALDL